MLEHSWSVTPSEAFELQRQLCSQIILKPFTKPIQYIAGADISFNKFSQTVYAGLVVLEAKTLQVVERASATMDVQFPYIPGYLSFREIPPLLKAFTKLKINPDVLVFDGHGVAHPRRMGIAAHAGSRTKLIDKKTKEQIGVAYRTKNKVKPVFISPGHLMDFNSAIRILETAIKGYRLPEPTRQAHLFVNEVRLQYLGRNQKETYEVSHR